MRCPFCGHTESRVTDTRVVGKGVRRRRECRSCGRRFTTYERLARTSLMVIKRDGRREEFDQDKLFVGIKKACAKRPISIETIDRMVDEIETELYSLGLTEVESRLIGEMVMQRLAQLDDVAYVRFASVYRRFADLDALAEEIQKLKARKALEEERQRQLSLGI